jgi:hypothetical protein
MKIELHSITFDGDLPLTEIQLKSIDRLFDHAKLERVVVHVNSTKATFVRDHIERFARDELGHALYSALVITDQVAQDIALSGVNGWVTQQLLKLEAVAASTADWVIMLDAKNHFVHRCSPQDFFSFGRAKINMTRVFPYWLQKINGARHAFGLPDVQEGAKVFPTITPFVMHPGVMREMLAAHKEKICDALTRGVGTEFFLYNAYIESRKLIDHLYSPTASGLCESLFTVSPQCHEAVMATLTRIADNKVPMFGLHRNRIPNLLDTEKAAIRSLWAPLGLTKDYLV